MSEHPIIFSGEIVRAILAGKKTQTRRVVRFPKNYQGLAHDDIEKSSFWVAHCLNCKECRAKGEPCGRKYWQTGDDILQQQYHPSDRLWVKETYIPSGHFIDAFDNPIPSYKATWDEQTRNTNLVEPRWLSPIFMPRWASRITLEITGVRVERVQEIIAEDALAEGVDGTLFWKPKELDEKFRKIEWCDDYYFWNHYPQIAYSKLWDSINAKRGYSWLSNPWVWVIEFKKVKP